MICDQCKKEIDNDNPRLQRYDEGSQKAKPWYWFKEKRICVDCLLPEYDPSYHISTHSIMEGFDTCCLTSKVRNYVRCNARPKPETNQRRG